MSTYRVQIRLNVRPDAGAAFVEYVAPVGQRVGLRVRNDVPGLLEGDGLSIMDLATLLEHLGTLPTDFAAASDLVGSGLVDDVWVHVTREREESTSGPRRA